MARLAPTVLILAAGSGLIAPAALAASSRTSFQVSLTIVPQCVATTSSSAQLGTTPEAARAAQVLCTGAIPYSISTDSAAGASAPAPRLEAVPGGASGADGSAPGTLIITVTY